MASRVAKISEGGGSEAEIQAAVNSYVTEYEFGIGGGGRTTDPLERAAKDLSLNAVKSAIRAAPSLTLASFSSAKLNELRDEHLDKNRDAIMNEAKAIVKAQAAAEKGAASIQVNMDLAGAADQAGEAPANSE